MNRIIERNEIASAAVQHRYSHDRYRLAVLDSMSSKEIRKELSSARSILRKRYERNKDVFSDQLKTEIERFIVPVREVSLNALPEQLAGIARILAGASSFGPTTRTGAQTRTQKIINGFQDAGYDFIDASNVNDFLKFAGEFTSKERDKLYGSGVLLKYYQHQITRRAARASRVAISKASFKKWLERQ